MKPQLVAGRIPVREALRAQKRRPHRIFLQQDLRGLDEIESLAAGIELERVPRHDLDRLSHGVTHQGVVLEADPLPLLDVATWCRGLPENPVAMLLDSIEDPQNFGGIVRSAAAFGAAGVVFPKDRSAPVSTAMLKAGAGAAEYVDLVRATNLVQTMKKLQKLGFWITGLAGDAEQTLWDTGLTGSVALVIGNEGRGMRPLVREHCDHIASIPLHGPISSLNASVSAAIALSECARQRRAD